MHTKPKRTGRYFETPTYYCHANYIHAIQEAGGLPLIIPQELDRPNMESILQECNGVCLLGGPGISAGLVGKLPTDLKPVEDRRILPELHALSCCRKDRIPVLGICYGMQLMNVFQGGTLEGVAAKTDTVAVYIISCEGGPTRTGLVKILGVDFFLARRGTRVRR